MASSTLEKSVDKSLSSRISMICSGEVKKRLEGDLPGWALWRSTVPGVCSICLRICGGRGCQWVMHPASNGIYFVTVTAIVVVWVVALTPLLDWAEIVTL